MKWNPGRLAAVLIVAAGLAAYADSFSGVFVLDDIPSIVDNPAIRHMTGLKAVLLAQSGSGLPVDGRPLLSLSLAVNYAIGGTHVWGYHAVNLAIHILAGLTLFGIVRRTLGGMPGRPSAEKRVGPEGPCLAALAVALLWVLHPLQTESVTYIVQRAESMMGLLYLLTLYCFIRHATEQPSSSRSGLVSRSSLQASEGGEDKKAARKAWAVLSVMACFLGMAAKEVMVSAPLMVWLYDRTFVSGTFRKAWRDRRGLYLGLASSWLLLGTLVISTNSRGHSAGFDSGVPWQTYALTQFGAVAHYLRLSFWPHPLVFDYGSVVISRLGDVAPQMAIVVSLLAATLVALRRWPSLGFCGAWFFAILAPTSSVVPVATQTIAEHRMYLPLAAVVTLAVAAIVAVGARRSLPVFLALALGLGFLTARRNEDYHSAVSIWSNTVAQHPESWRAQSDLGIVLAEDPGRLPEAMSHFEEALRLNPNSAQAHINLATVLAENPGRLPEAISHYEQALRLDPNLPEAHFDLAIALAKSPGRLPEAVSHYEQALRLKPDYAEAHNNLAIALAKIPGRLPEAILHYEEALRLNPNYADAHYNLAGALAGTPERLPEAFSHYEQALRLKPDYAEAHFALAIALAGDPARMPEAIPHLEAALRLKPDLVEAHIDLANMLAGEPARLPEAISHYEQALRLQPDSAEVHNNLAIVLARNPGRLPEAVSHFEAALRLQPDFAEAHNNLANALTMIPGRMPEAVAHYEAALRINPSYADAHCNIAAAYVKMGRLDEAIAHLESALKIDPSLVEARKNLGKLRAMSRP